ncbi:hypothetical protein GCM10010215_26570 [Streptomyces virginiae]|uniref:Uncharacterized protein n=1 Tax=Streptomyces virginiae TaxID=1961 RepID=A0ABQ3NN55_STRVG|nr:hypothetical protein GCM10010215_26570 [Streptomyces virginiae]GHI14164.1 hypothetical protein Scinn_36270 [Streptomyces virginiae]
MPPCLPASANQVTGFADGSQEGGGRDAWHEADRAARGAAQQPDGKGEHGPPHDERDGFTPPGARPTG